MIYHVFANKVNIGDWLSARAIQSLLRVEEITELFCNEPMVPQTLEVLRQAKETDLVIIGGGGLFMDYFTPFWEGFRGISECVPFCIWGVGYCDLKRENSRARLSLLEQIIAHSRITVVRDELTRQYLSACALPPPVACPTFNLVHSGPESWGLLHVDAFDNVGQANYDWMEEAGRDFAAHTGRRFERINNEIVPGKELGLLRTLEAYARADLILTGRLHGCIIGLAMGRKVLVVSGDRKLESFMTSAGLQDWVLDLDRTRELPQYLERLARQPAPTRFLAEVRRQNRAIAAKVLQVYRSLGNGSCAAQRLEPQVTGAPALAASTRQRQLNDLQVGTQFLAP